MVNLRWPMICSGISIIGSYHNINQDFFYTKPYRDGYIMVVSDGMGSKIHSHIGSKCICESVYDVISNFKYDLDLISFKDVLYSCHNEWKKRLIEYDITECYATLLVVVLRAGKLQAARLGDGFIAIYTDNEVTCLYDKKEDFFLNETDCLKDDFVREKVEVIEIEFKKFHGVISCTDGIEIGRMQENDLSSFAKEFIREYSIREKDEILLEVENWLTSWPGSDDKTLAFMMKGEKVNV